MHDRAGQSERGHAESESEGGSESGLHARTDLVRHAQRAVSHVRAQAHAAVDILRTVRQETMAYEIRETMGYEVWETMGYGFRGGGFRVSGMRQ